MAQFIRETKKQVLSDVSFPEEIVGSKIVGHALVEYERKDGTKALRYHHTDLVVTDPKGYRSLYTGGWRTMSTSRNINRYLEPAWSVGSGRSGWELQHRTGEETQRWPFAEGITITPRGKVLGAATKKDLAKRSQLQEDIRKFAKACVDAMPLDLPSAGDCWYCSMQTQGGQALGDATGNNDHLLSHVKDGYIVPSLIMNIMKANGYWSVIWAGYAFKLPEDQGGTQPLTDHSRKILYQMIRNYMRDRLVDKAVAA